MPRAVLPRAERVLLAAVTTDFHADMRRIFSRNALGRHLMTLCGATLQRRRLCTLLHYGMEHLPPDKRRPDDSMATYFLVVSELKVCPYPVRIFATKCMEYCESEALDGWSESLADLKRAYGILTRTMGPLLRR